MTKKETLDHWKQLTPGQPIMDHMRPLAYKSTGSTVERLTRNTTN